ncbi:hypothetical protein [Cohnella kolymensis]|uniref:hypothetical protein n=1 Tax=Cohnella kolymensis TaxID=1590652 RepID=UPI000A7BF5D6|nr:hypothetical protein [Cohnella kolymensis]
MELHGTKASILIEDGRVRQKPAGGEWEEVKLPERLSMPMEQWASAIEEGYQPSIGKRDAVLLTLINEAAAESHRSGCKVELDNIRNA